MVAIEVLPLYVLDTNRPGDSIMPTIGSAYLLKQSTI